MLQNLILWCRAYYIYSSTTSGDDLESFGNVTGIFLKDGSSSINAISDGSGEPKSSTSKSSLHLRLGYPS